MKNLIILVLLFIFILPTFSKPIELSVQELALKTNKQVIDEHSSEPISNAKIVIPSKGFQTYTNEAGYFDIPIDIDQDVILSIQKEGYAPFSLVVNENNLDGALKLKIHKQSGSELYVEDNLIHLGDNIFSDKSANASDFRTKALGPIYNKKLGSISNSSKAYVVIGSIIGIDTLVARKRGQNKIITSYSSPVLVLFNSHKIGEISLNGNNHRFLIPKKFIANSNTLSIQTGVNLFQKNYKDYDDIEFANVHIDYD